MAKMTLKEFRREAAKRRAGRARGAARYTDELKQFALAHADQRMAEGRSGKQAAKELDLCAVTLYGWQKERRAPKGQLKPVEVKADAFEADGETLSPVPERAAAPTRELTIRTPAGFEVHGLDMDSAVALLRALG